MGEPELDQLSWVRIVPAVAHDPSLPPGLGAGEAATIALASMENARAVLLDELLARRVARQRGLPIIGTLGVLLVAKQSGLLVAVRPVVDAMIAQGRHISTTLRAQVLRAAGEEE
jgi:predicted nucleic acid-binding protein